MALWGFLRRSPSPELASAIQQRVERLTFELAEVVKVSQSVVEAANIARRLETRVLSCERQIKNLEGILSDFENRVTGTVESLRSSINGARGGRPRNSDREAQELGFRLMQAMQDPQARQQLINELQTLAMQNGQPMSPI